MEDTYQKVLTFLHEAEKLKSTLRHNWLTTGRQEDSSQHAWRTAIFFIVAQRIFKFDVDEYKTLSMILLHDMPEIKFGDIPAFIKDTDVEAHTKHKLREKEAAKELYNLLPLPMSNELLSLQEEFDLGETPEAKVAQALEKIESQLQHLESGPNYWSEEEKGEHMLHYPDKAIANLNNDHIKQMWQMIYDEIHQLTYPENGEK